MEKELTLKDIINNLTDCLQRSQEFIKEHGDISSELDTITDDMLLLDDIEKSLEDCFELTELIDSAMVFAVNAGQKDTGMFMRGEYSPFEFGPDGADMRTKYWEWAQEIGAGVWKHQQCGQKTVIVNQQTKNQMVDMRKIWKAQLDLCQKIAEDIVKHNASKEVCRHADGFASIGSPFGIIDGDMGNDYIRIHYGEAYVYVDLDKSNVPTGNIWCINDEMGVEHDSTYQGTIEDLEHMTIEEAYEKCAYPDCYDEYANKEDKYAKGLYYVPYEFSLEKTDNVKDDFDSKIENVAKDQKKEQAPRSLNREMGL